MTTPVRHSLAVAAACGACLTATAARAAPPWSVPQPVPGSSGVGFPYDIAVRPDGTAAVAFVRTGVRVAIRRPDGRWSPTRRISSARTAATAPDVAVDERGEILVAWTQSSVAGGAPPIGRSTIRIAIRTARGRWTAARTVGITQHFIDGQPRLAVNARGDAVIAWRGQAGRGATAHDAIQAAFRPAGGRFRTAHGFGQLGTDVTAAMNAGGEAFVAWTHPAPPSYVPSSISLATRRAREGWTSPQTIGTTSAGGPQLAPRPDGRLLLAWREAQQGLGATRTGLPTIAERAEDGAVGPPHQLSDTRTTGPQIVSAPGAEPLVAWNTASALQIGAGPGALFWTTLAADGTYGPPQSRAAVEPGPLAMLADGSTIAMWSTVAVRAVARPPGGTFGPAELVAARGRFPALAAGDRIAVAVWLANGRLAAAARSNADAD